ncbi:hypothetical protein VB713_04585 [Anabaena cylindrica UHCC 0172]|uniref:hypothetical protein n=1 Tax=Anabaena cylindrica TaxID=1165 RepID=UPI002B1EC1E4|nr:hypothetical protein [Anabaena cylindrica]MEA5550266.1 hypothetical protein [Anabaena cylindrica UHCC 0172]
MVEVITQHSFQIFVTFITIWIAFQQYQVNKNKLEYDLFDKRLKVFVALQDFLTVISGKINDLDNIVNNQPISKTYSVVINPPKEVFINYQKVIPISEFIFNQDIHSYLLEIESEGKELLNILENANNTKFSTEETDKLKFKLINRRQWCTNQLSISRQKFIKYLKLKTFN